MQTNQDKMAKIQPKTEICRFFFNISMEYLSGSDSLSILYAKKKSSINFISVRIFQCKNRNVGIPEELRENKIHPTPV